MLRLLDLFASEPSPVVICRLTLTRPIPARRDESLTVTLVRSGSMRKILPDRSIHLTAGTLVICDASVLASQRPLAPTSIIRMQIADSVLRDLEWVAQAPGLGLLARALGRDGAPLVLSLTPQRTAAIAASMTQLLAAQATHGPYQLQRLARFVAVLSEIDDAIGGTAIAEAEHRARAAARPAPGWRPEVQRAVELLERDPDQPWTVARLAAHVHLSRSRLALVFHDEVGTTPFQYLRELRLREMAATLLDTPVSMTEAAHRAGWANESHARALFQRRWGMSPAEFRMDEGAAS